MMQSRPPRQHSIRGACNCSRFGCRAGKRVCTDGEGWSPCKSWAFVMFLVSQCSLARGIRQTQEPQGPRITGTGEKEREGMGWRQRPLVTCGASGPPRSACSRSRRSSRARGAGTPAASHAAGCAGERPAAVGGGLHRRGPRSPRCVCERAWFRCASWRPAGGARTRRTRTHRVRMQARANRTADGLPLEDAGGEKDSERTAGLRRPHLSDAQRQAARIERCLHQKRSVHPAARALQDSKPADAGYPGVRASLHAAHPVAAPAAPLDAAEPALQLTRKQQQEVVGIVSSNTHIREVAAGPSGWTFEMICAACQ